MARLFDAGKEEQKVDDVRRRREGVRARAAAVEEALKDHEELDEKSRRIGQQLADVQSVQPIRYSEFRAPGSKWLIEHARVGDDYVYQLFPLRPPKIQWRDIVLMMIGAMDAIFPRSIVIKYVPPSSKYQVKFFTIRANDVASLPGWEEAVKRRALASLSSIDAWPSP